MSISSSLFSGVSGLSSYGNSMSVIGDNIANVNTIGFKGSHTSFEDAFSQSIATASGTSQIGRGVSMSSVTASFAQGSFESTNEPTDLAIGGKGFFMVNNKDNGNIYFTRAGHFRFDVEGNFVNPAGLVVQGWDVQENIDGTISTVGAIDDIVISSTSSDPNSTTEVIEAVNLSSSESIYDPLLNPFTLDQVTGAVSNYNYSTSLSVYDSLGEAHPVTIYFTKTGAGSWDWNAVVDGTNSQDGLNHVMGAGTLTFSSAGILTGEAQGVNDFDFTGGAVQSQTINFRFGTQPNAISKSTQFSSASTTIYQNQDGYGSGFLENVSVDTDGVIAGHYSNGQILYLNKISLANFQNPWGLTKQGGNLWSESRGSGQAITGPPGTAGLGMISPNSLEQSNVDLGTEFVKMIITQRAFQANSRIITTTDDMLAELINLKR